MPETEEDLPKEEADTQGNDVASNEPFAEQHSSDEDLFAEPYEDEDMDKQQDIFLFDEPYTPSNERDRIVSDDEDSPNTGNDMLPDDAVAGVRDNRGDRVESGHKPAFWSSALYRFLTNRKIDSDFLVDREHTKQE